MKLYPVVHINDIETAKREAEHALEAGVDGVYLIDHHNGANDTSAVFDTYKHLKNIDKDSYVGVNILGASAIQAIKLLPIALDERKIPVAPDGWWTDDIRVKDFEPHASMEYKLSTPTLVSTRILGGVAFKYRETYTDDPEEARAEAAELRRAVDVVTTSGAGTGEEPSVEKLAAMKEEIGSQPLAVASGISASNIEKYARHVDEVLAATSIETEKGSGVFDRDKLAELLEIAHDLR